MAKMYSSGPALLYLDHPQSGPVFMGTAETAPDIELTYEYEPIFNDLAGSRLPMDRIYEGQEAIVSAILTFWNQSTLDFLDTINDGTVGLDNLGSTGTIMGQEDMTFEFGVLFPFAAKAAYSDLPAGYNFASCLRIGGYKIEPGTKVNKRHIIIKAQRKLLTIPNNLTGDVFKLYDFDVSKYAGVAIQ